MKQITIRDLEDSVVHRLKKIAWAEGVPPDETARRLLIEAIQSRTARMQPTIVMLI
jgi:plasmid stability protein